MNKSTLLGNQVAATLPVNFSKGSGIYDIQPVNKTAASWGEFCAEILGDVSPAKGHAWIAAQFNGTRCSENVAPRNWIGLDIDGTTPEDFAQIVAKLQSCNALIYTTASHKDESPRARIIIELTQSASRESVRLTSERIRLQLSTSAKWDAACDRSEQPLFLPVMGFKHWQFSGQAVAPISVALPVPKPYPTPAVVPHAAAIAVAEMELARTLERVASVPEGSRNHHINGAAHAMGRFVGAGRLDQQSTIKALHAATVSAGWADLQKTLNTIRSAIRKGAKDPAVLVIDNLPVPVATPLPLPKPDTGIYSAADLMTREFKPVQWALQDILPEGVTILSGPPKCGKSWLVYQACVAVATGTPLWAGRAPEIAGDALYIALEDNPRRMQRRLQKVIENIPSPNLARLHCVHDWPRSHEGVAKIAAWIRANPETRLVVIDTLAAFRDSDPGRKSAYAFDYEVGESLKPLTREFNVSIVLVSHTRKQAATDYMQMVSGTQGLTGSVDNVIALERGKRGDFSGVLRVDGRDVEEPVDLALSLEDGRWTYVGKVDEIERSRERNDVIEAMVTLGVPSSAREIFDAMEPGAKYATVKMRLSRMLKAGEISKSPIGYFLERPTIPPPTSKS
ncbi:AAA family ATPase [Xanthomonas euvesicatoria]|uniref:AAA family ATPase n=1 Tax=Xanthomonas euvesicatoria TaxID=456327 RepID=UPI001C47340D|nr:AAA family ATPase [Xanthomonas euvesicatoria]MBV6867261.1 helicase RepA family protein [Xanthomonas campestris pv. coriandri]MCE4330224.1 helicase RepA family protein [Xanthomonas campestris pv. coriandri]